MRSKCESAARPCEVIFIDFEFYAPPGERPRPICMVVYEMVSGRRFRIALWGCTHPVPPFAMGPDVLFCAYYASAEIGCLLVLGWPVPVNVLDLFVEFRVLTNGRVLPCGSGLLGALAFYGLNPMDAAEKEEMRALAPGLCTRRAPRAMTPPGWWLAVSD